MQFSPHSGAGRGGEGLLVALSTLLMTEQLRRGTPPSVFLYSVLFDIKKFSDALRVYVTQETLHSLAVFILILK